MNMKQKIFVMAIIPFAGLILFNIISVSSIKLMSNGIDVIVEDNFSALLQQDIFPLIEEEMLPLINNDIKNIQNYENSIKLLLEADRDVHQALIAEKDCLIKKDDEYKKADKNNAENIEQAKSRINKASAFFDSDNAKGLYSQLTSEFEKWKQNTRNVVKDAADPDKIMQAKISSESGAAMLSFDSMRDLIDKLQTSQQKTISQKLNEIEEKRKLINQKDEIIKAKNNDIKNITAKINETITGRKTILYVFSGILLIVIPLVAFIFGKSIVGNLQSIIKSLTLVSDQVSDGSATVAQSSQQMAEGASEQASSLEEISSSLEEISSMTRQNADNARQSNNLAKEARGAAEEGNSAMDKMAKAINEIQMSTNETAKIIKTIDEIAFQTNLLALNAAVEAARAGEAGKGFAVVAEEVRNLAMRSAEAAKSTSELIEGSQKNSENGVAVSNEVGEILKKISEKVNNVTGLIAEVSSASDEQTQGIQQVTTAVSQMDHVTQSNAANAEESASASEELSSQSQELNSMVGVLTGMIEGGNKSVTIAKTQYIAPKKSYTVPKPQALNRSVSVKAPERTAANKEVTPDQVIPLEDDEF